MGEAENLNLVKYPWTLGPQFAIQENSLQPVEKQRDVETAAKVHFRRPTDFAKSAHCLQAASLGHKDCCKNQIYLVLPAVLSHQHRFPAVELMLMSSGMPVLRRYLYYLQP